MKIKPGYLNDKVVRKEVNLVAGGRSLDTGPNRDRLTWLEMFSQGAAGEWVWSGKNFSQGIL